MATGIILAGGGSSRIPGDKALLRVGGRPVIEVQLEVTRGLFEETLIVGRRENVGALARFAGPRVRVIEEVVRGKGPLGGIYSGLETSGSSENFVLACDMPFIKRDAVAFVMDGLRGFQVAVPRTPGGLEPLHAAYHRDCLDVVARQLESGRLKVIDFYPEVSVNYIAWEELKRFDASGRLLFNTNSEEDVKTAEGHASGVSSCA